jgi:hypothetical protein
MRADVDGCVVFASFVFVEIDAEELGAIGFSGGPGGSASFWLLFFFFAIAQEVFLIANIAIRSVANRGGLLEDILFRNI